MKIISLFFASLTHAMAGDLEDEVENLAAQFAKLESYQASYHAETQDGKKGTFTVGMHHESGWGYIMSDLRNADGAVLQKSEQWATADGKFVMAVNGKAIVYEGLGKLLERLGALKKLFKGDGEIHPSRLVTSAFLSEKRAETMVGLGNTKPPWLKNLDKLVGTTDEKAQMIWGKKGMITVDRKTGFLIEQEIEVEDGKRTLKLTDWKRNPSAKDISKRMSFDLEDAPQRDIGEIGMSKKLLRTVLQEFVDATGRIEGNLPEYLEGLEDDFVTYLEGEPLDGPNIFKPAAVAKLLAKPLANARELARKTGQEFDAQKVFEEAVFRKKVEDSLTAFALRKTPHKFREVVQPALLGARLEAKGKEQTEARAHLEKFLEKCYLRATLRRGIEKYFEAEKVE